VTNFKKTNPALGIALFYLLAGCLWIMVSDVLVFRIPERHLRQLLQTSKGWLFVSITAMFLYYLINRYLTQEERSRQELTAKEERLSLALASSRTGVWEWNLRTDRVVWSPEVYGIVGLPGFNGEFPSFVPLIHPDDLEHVLATVQQALVSKEDYTDEFRIIRPDTGEVRWLKNLGKARYDAGGTPIFLLGTVQDVTKQKQSQEALQVSDERLKLLLQGVKIGVWDLNLQTGIAYLSPEYYEIAEYSPESVVPDMAFFKSLVHPDDYERVMAAMDAHMRGETADSNASFRIITGNGAIKWIASRGNVVRRDQSDAPLRMAGTMVDVTAHRLAEEQFEQFFNMLPDLACIASPDGYFLKVNRVWSATLGYSEEELLAMPYLNLIHPDDRLATSREVASHADGKSAINFVNRYRCRDDSYRWLEWTATPAANENLIFATARDITERKQAELQLMESEVRFSTIFHSNPVACGISRKETNQLVDVNDAFLTLFGYGRDEVIGRTTLDLGIWPYPEEREAFYTLFTGQGRVSQFEAHFRHKSGRIGSLMISVEEIILDGEPYLMGMLVDISMRKAAEAALLASEERYRAVVDDQTEIICRFLPDGTLTFVNETYCHTFGKSSRDLIGTKWMPIVPQDDIPLIETELAKLSPDNPLIVIENRAVDAQGRLRWLQFVNHGLYDNCGTLQEVQAVGRDITDRKLIELELVRSEEQFFTAFDRCPFLMAISTIEDGRYIAVNDLFLTALGLQRENVINRSSRELNIFDDYRDREHILKQVQETGFVSGYEVKIRKRSGEIITGLFSAEIITLQKKSCLLTTLNDITSMKNSEKALRENEERYRRLFEMESDAILMVDNGSGALLDANAAAIELYGYEKEELLTLNVVDISAEPLEAENALSNTVVKAPIRMHRNKCGDCFPVEIAASCFDFQGRQVRVAAIRDISERLLAEDQLRNNERMYRSLFENMLNGFAYCKMICEEGQPVDFVYLGVNDAFYRLTGLVDVVGKSISQIIPGFRESGRELLELYGRVARTGIPENFENYIGMLGDWYSISVYSPEPDYFVAVFDVVTDRKEAEKQLLALNEKLRTLSEHLQAVQEQERLSIARDIHDDIGQQLTSLKLDITWLARQLCAVEGSIGERLEGMTAAIDLLLTRVQQIASELRPPLLDNLGLAAAIEWQVSEFTRRNGIECIVMLNEDAEPDSPQAATSVVRVVQEALTNVSRHAGASEVSISLCRHDGEILLEITDNGCGIEEKDIMSPDSFGVLGMQERARLCGGWLDFDRLPQGGTRLRMIIPAKTGERVI